MGVLDSSTLQMLLWWWLLKQLITVSYGAPFIYLIEEYPGYRSLSTFKTVCGDVSKFGFESLVSKISFEGLVSKISFEGLVSMLSFKRV